MKENKEYQIGEEIKYQLAGWILFIICAIFFIASSLKNHDILTFIGEITAFDRHDFPVIGRFEFAHPLGRRPEAKTGQGGFFGEKLGCGEQDHEGHRRQETGDGMGTDAQPGFPNTGEKGLGCLE